MAKRFTATEIWVEDWFLDCPIEYKLFWYYMLSNCDHAGLFKVNLGSFCLLNGVKLTSTIALTHFNTGKQRIREITSTLWLIEDFFQYQYGTIFNWNNRVHESIGILYKKHKIELTSIRGLKDLKERAKDKDKDKDISIATEVDLPKHKKSGFNTTPTVTDFNGLPEQYVRTACEMIFMTKQIRVTEKEINPMWEIFKVQKLTGADYYPNEGKVYSHFVDWVKTKDLKSVQSSKNKNSFV